MNKIMPGVAASQQRQNPLLVFFNKASDAARFVITDECGGVQLQSEKKFISPPSKITKDKDALVGWIKKNQGKRLNLRGLDLSDADLRDLNLPCVDFTDTDLRFTNFAGTKLTNSILTGAEFGGANLYKTDMSNANLKKAKLGGADICETIFTGANLKDATFPIAAERYLSPKQRNQVGKWQELSARCLEALDEVSSLQHHPDRR